MKRAPIVVALAVLAAASSVFAAQDSDKQKPLKNGDAIVAKGCLKGPTLEAADVGPKDAGSLTPSGLTFQLKGKKEVLKDLIAKHDGQTVEIAGVLKSNLDSGAAARGHRIGNTTIVVGAQSATRDRAMRPVTEEVLPVLEVKSYEGAGMNCRR